MPDSKPPQEDIDYIDQVHYQLALQRAEEFCRLYYVRPRYKPAPHTTSILAKPIEIMATWFYNALQVQVPDEDHRYHRTIRLLAAPLITLPPDDSNHDRPSQ